MKIDYTLHLPDEMLLLVFHSARLTNGFPDEKSAFEMYHSEEHDAKSKRDFFLAWLPLTHVCARWRALALGDPSMWTIVPVVLGDKWMYTFIERTNELPFSVEFLSDSDKDGVTEELASRYHQRMRNLRIEVGLTRWTLPALARFWPELEDIDISISRGLSIHEFLGDCAPRLRSLKLYQFGDGRDVFSGEAHLLNTSTLVSLDIKLYQDIPAPSMIGFMDALSRMPLLEHLRFEGTHACPSALCCGGTERSCGALLKSVDLQCNWTAASCVLDHIFPPPDVRISLDAYNNTGASSSSSRDRPGGDAMQKQLRDFCARIRELRCKRGERGSGRSDGDEIAALRALPYTAFQVHFSHYSMTVSAACSVEFSSQDHLKDWAKGVVGLHPDLRITVPWSPSRIWWGPSAQDAPKAAAEVFTHILETLAEDSMRNLSLTGSVPSNFLSFCSPRSFQNVEVLRMSLLSHAHLLSLRGKGSSYGKYKRGASQDDETGDVMLFPALKRLHFETCTLEDVQRHLDLQGGRSIREDAEKYVAVDAVWTLERILSRRRDKLAKTAAAACPDVLVYLPVTKEVATRYVLEEYEEYEYKSWVRYLE